MEMKDFDSTTIHEYFTEEDHQVALALSEKILDIFREGDEVKYLIIFSALIMSIDALVRSIDDNDIRENYKKLIVNLATITLSKECEECGNA